MLLIRLALLMTGWLARDSEWMSVVASARILRCLELHGRAASEGIMER